MPHPSQTDREKILTQARGLIEREGVEALSLSKLADGLGIKAPSLYKHFASKDALLRAVNTITIQGLVGAMQKAINQETDPRAGLINMALAFRTFVHANPNAYVLVFARLSPDTAPAAELSESLALPLQKAWSAAFGEVESLSGLRGAWALLHGYIILELNGQFQRGGDVATMSMQAFEHYIAGWERALV